MKMEFKTDGEFETYIAQLCLCIVKNESALTETFMDALYKGLYSYSTNNPCGAMGAVSRLCFEWSEAKEVQRLRGDLRVQGVKWQTEFALRHLEYLKTKDKRLSLTKELRITADFLCEAAQISQPGTPARKEALAVLGAVLAFWKQKDFEPMKAYALKLQSRKLGIALGIPEFEKLMEPPRPAVLNVFAQYIHVKTVG